MSMTSENSVMNGHGVLNELTLESLANTPAQSLRFYPRELPAFAHEPTRDRFEIRHISHGVGEGVVSLSAFQPGDVVFACSGYFSDEVTLFSLQIAPGLHLHDPYFYGKLLHSCDPNTYVELASRRFVARRTIRPGEYITLDYARTEDTLFRTFPCHCGAANCRGEVAGRLQLASNGAFHDPA